MDCYFIIRNHMTVFIYVAVIRMIMMPSCPYFILSTPLSLNMWTYFSISAFAWGQARSKLVGVDTSILHHAFISIFIALWAVITHYDTILMPILSYFTRFTWRGGMSAAGILGWKRSKYRDLFCTSPKVLKLHRNYFQNIYIVFGLAKEKALLKLGGGLSQCYIHAPKWLFKKFMLGFLSIIVHARYFLYWLFYDEDY